jgi:hypothetical protein
MALEDDDPIRRLLARQPRPRLSDEFSRELMRRVRQQEQSLERQRGLGTRLVLGAYWLAALVATAWILRQEPLPGWLVGLLWTGALLLVPAGYALALWTSMGGLAKHEREV